MLIRGREFKNDTYIMGILNVTPDSFSDGGSWTDVDLALRHTERMIEEGASVIDIGGESTRPGYTVISSEEEIRRTVPVIKAVRARFDAPVSIDTYKSAVARAALDAGADMVNDIWGFKADKNIAAVCKSYGASCCLMHNRDNADYGDFYADVLDDLRESINIALEAGIEPEKICTDPGIGFAKSLEQNLMITQNADILDGLGFPVLVGASRKSMIGLTLGLDKGERLEGTLAVSVIAALKGCLFVRVHDVKENYRAVKMARELMKYRR